MQFCHSGAASVIDMVLQDSHCRQWLLATLQSPSGRCHTYWWPLFLTGAGQQKGEKCCIDKLGRISALIAECLASEGRLVTGPGLFLPSTSHCHQHSIPSTLPLLHQASIRRSSSEEMTQVLQAKLQASWGVLPSIFSVISHIHTDIHPSGD